MQHQNGRAMIVIEHSAHFPPSCVKLFTSIITPSTTGIGTLDAGSMSSSGGERCASTHSTIDSAAVTDAWRYVRRMTERSWQKLCLRVCVVSDSTSLTALDSVGSRAKHGPQKSMVWLTSPAKHSTQR